jgi:hypothetical protein
MAQLRGARNVGGGNGYGDQNVQVNGGKKKRESGMLGVLGGLGGRKVLGGGGGKYHQGTRGEF